MPSLLASSLSSKILIHTYIDHVSVFIPAAPNQAKQCWSAGRMPSFNTVLCCVVVQYRDGDLWRLWCQDSSLCRLRLTEHIQHLASSQFLKTTVATRRLALAWPLLAAALCHKPGPASHQPSAWTRSSTPTTPTPQLSNCYKPIISIL